MRPAALVFPHGLHTVARRFPPLGQRMSPFLGVVLVWVLWVVSWIAASGWSAPAIKSVGLETEWLYRAVTFGGGFLLFAMFPPVNPGLARLWPPDSDAEWALVGLAVLGFLFSWWARLYLGRLWSSSVTRKADHHVVDTGPYALVRHPIYTGIITAVFATAFIKATPISLLGAVVMTLGFWIKARLEERFLREQLGAEAYDSYRRRVPMLMPFGPKSA
jgi:protein-S-isoprenylcysteine O-methyltransferase Ste14